MKILYLTTVGATMGFFECFIRELLEEGHTIDIACNDKISPVPECYKEWGCRIYSLPCSRTPFAVGNIKTIQKIKRLVEKKKYDIVHCHTPIASVCTRIACRRVRKKGTKVFYTAHGFHFYTGAPLKNWLIYYPAEWICSWLTDVLITINREDYKRAKQDMHARRIVYVPGVGVDTKKFSPSPDGRKKIRNELGVSEDRIVLLSVGELNANKNHVAVIRAIQGLDLTYVIVGEGEMRERLMKIAEEVHVDLRLMGFRSDVSDFYNAADVYVLPSIREGLNVSLMEAMASELPCAVSNIRGNIDLISKPLFEPTDIDEIKKAIIFAIEHKEELGRRNFQKVRSLDVHRVNRLIFEIHRGRLSENSDDHSMKKW